MQEGGWKWFRKLKNKLFSNFFKINHTGRRDMNCMCFLCNPVYEVYIFNAGENMLLPNKLRKCY